MKKVHRKSICISPHRRIVGIGGPPLGQLIAMLTLPEVRIMARKKSLPREVERAGFLTDEVRRAEAMEFRR